MKVDHHLELLHCFRCGIAFAVPQPWLVGKAKAGPPIRCAAGHRLVYAMTDDEAAAKAMATATKALVRETVSLRDQVKQLTIEKFRLPHEVDRTQARQQLLFQEPIETSSPSGHHCPICHHQCKRRGTAMLAHIVCKHGESESDAMGLFQRSEPKTRASTSSSPGGSRIFSNNGGD